MEFYDFPYIGNVIVPTDSYFSEGLTPPTRYMYIYIIDFNLVGFYSNRNGNPLYNRSLLNSGILILITFLHLFWGYYNRDQL